MTMPVESWHLVTFLAGLLVTFLGFAFGFAKVLLSQVERRLDERFASLETNREEFIRYCTSRSNAVDAAIVKEDNRLADLERHLLTLKAELPEKYVRREDWIRFAAVIDAKQDALSEKLNTLNARLAGLLERTP